MRKISKFQFVVPNTRWFGKRSWTWDVPGVTILAPLLRKQGYDLDILEANLENLTPDQVKQGIGEYGPDVVAISNMSIEYWAQLHEVAKLTKEVSRNIIVIAGGVHATTLPERLMQDTNVDYTVLSEGEERLPQLLNIIKKDDGDFSKMNGVLYRENGQVKKITSSGWYRNLDATSFPDFSIYKNPEKIFDHQQKSAGGLSTRRTPVASILTSRGCPYRCSFCSAPVTTGHKYRWRSPESVLKEIDMLVHDFGVREIIFQDDEMYAHKKRAAQIIQMIRDRKYKDLIWKNFNLASWRMDLDLIKLMKESGCYQITISPESGNARVLKEIIHKPTDLEMSRKVSRWCKEVGIELQADFVFGFPGETWDEIRDTCNYADELDADSVKFAVATPFPATELLRVAVERGMFPKDYDFYTNDYVGFANPTMESDEGEWTSHDLKVMRVMEWDRINFKTEEKKKRYAKINEMTIEELEHFRAETRKNLGVYFTDHSEKDKERDAKNKSPEEQKWERIRRTASLQSSISHDEGAETIHEVI